MQVKHTPGHKWFARKYGIQPPAGVNIEPVIKEIEEWRAANGLPHPTSPLTMGVARTAIAKATGN